MHTTIFLICRAHLDSNFIILNGFVQWHRRKILFDVDSKRNVTCDS